MNNTINTNDLLKFLIKEQTTKGMDLEIALELFMSHIKLNNRNGTYHYYQSIFKPIINYLYNHDIKQTNKINKQILNYYIKYRQNNNVSNNTINKELTAINTLFNFLIKNEYISYQDIKVPKLKEIRKEIQIVKNDDLIKILNYIPTLQESSQLIILLLLTTGIRTNELVNIKNKNIDIKNKRIYLEFTKSGNPRYIFIDDNVIQLLINTINKNNIYLFTNEQTKEKFKTSAVRSLIARIKRVLNIEILSAHKLRHTFATSLIENGADIESTRLLLGHTTYEMTKRYLHINANKLKNVSNNLNPLEAIKNQHADKY